MPSHRQKVATALERERGAARVIEFFQAQFLAVASADLPHPDYAVKGGVNMRFFFQSHRSSKDMDFDYLGDRLLRFAERVDQIFTGRALTELLRLDDVALARVTRPKATETTQRWKFGLVAPGVPDASSKVEFSARGTVLPYELAAVDPVLAGRLRVRPMRICHYLPEAAAVQKVEALRGRAHTEPRDVFDLDHLFTRYPDVVGRIKIAPAVVKAAVERASGLSYPEFESTVVPYLDEDLRPVLGSRAAWEDMQLRVIERLEAAMVAQQ
ncbi:MAG: nucleotidyl transferase AbiEii/AbiGii toxin family protein [Chloroflexi bacterium]|nr:nucleotidyl transferase AbiEii/AbiGii toxin family protein [Chloroflexota bacterium]